jgi:hypothetical protein
MSDFTLAEKTTATEIIVTLHPLIDGGLSVKVSGVLHDRLNMLRVAAALRRAAELIEVRDAAEADAERA